jgi:hypothetical protein
MPSHYDPGKKMVTIERELRREIFSAQVRRWSKAEIAARYTEERVDKLLAEAKRSWTWRLKEGNPKFIDDELPPL